MYDERTALIVVDVQNDFADRNGSLYVEGAEEVVLAANREIERAQRAGAFVVYTQDWHPESTPHFTKDGGVWPVHCVGETWGAKLHPDLVVDGPVVRKGVGGEDGYSGFGLRDPQTGEQTPTELEGLLRERGITKVVVVGLALDYCVKETVLDAVRLGFETIVPLEVTRPVDMEPGDGDRAVADVQRAGAVTR